MTNQNDPTDAIAIKIGQLFVESDQQKKINLANGLEQIKLFEEQEIIRGRNYLYSSSNRSFVFCLIEIQELEDLQRRYHEEKKLAEEKEKLTMEQVSKKREELKRKFGSK